MMSERQITPEEAYLIERQNSAFIHSLDASPMPSVALGRPPESDQLYGAYDNIAATEPALYEAYNVKRGLRNSDGSGVVAGLTTISSVHGYDRGPDGPVPAEGDLKLRGYHLDDLVHNPQSEDRFGYEEVAYLLISGRLPNRDELADFNARIDSRRGLPVGYLDIFPRRTASHSIMNVLARSTLLLYAFDPKPDDTTPEHEIDVTLSLLGRLPRIAAIAHRARQDVDAGARVRIPPVRYGYSMAETVLDVLRGDEGFTRQEAMLLDVMLMLHAEHGGGNNSTFACRVLSSSGTDAYSAYAAAMGSLKGPKHGGANHKGGVMIDDIAEHVSDWTSDTQILDYLHKLRAGTAGDGSRLIYGMGHAVYTLSDPRAQIIKGYARDLAESKGLLDKFRLIESVERLAPDVINEGRSTPKPICANIDLYSGFVYGMLGVPQNMTTPLFAIARMAGWAAHRMEELYGAARIIRPAYVSVMGDLDYVPLSERD